MQQRPEFGYDPKGLQRELARHYITATEEEINEIVQGGEELTSEKAEAMEAVESKSAFVLDLICITRS